MGQRVSFLAIVCLAQRAVFASSSWTDKLNHGSVQGFPSYEEANELLEQFLRSNPNELEKRQIGTSFQSRPIYAYVLATPAGRQNKPQALLTALMHAREPAGLTVLLYFLGHLLEKYSRGDPDATYILNMREIWFLPFVNPDGYIANKGLRNKVIRKNRRPTCRSSVDGGVDINRNFAVHWSSSFGGCSEEHGGSQPFSEPETQAFKKICEENAFKTAMNFHAYGSMLTHPFNWATQDLMPAEDKRVYQEIARVFGYKKFGPAIKTVGYTTSGESDDWMYSARHIISMSPEVGPESGGFWPPSSQIDGIDTRNFDRALYVVGKAGMELGTEWVQQPLPPSGADLSALPGGPPHHLLKLRITNRGLTGSHGKVLHIAVRGVVIEGAAAGDAVGLLVSKGEEDDETREMLTSDHGILAWKAKAIPSRSFQEFRMYISRSREPEGQKRLQTCVAEASGTSACQCSELVELPGSTQISKQSSRQFFALPAGREASGDSMSSLCAAASTRGVVDPNSKASPVLASSMETVESLVPPRDTGDSDHDDWERVDDDVAVARATLAHNVSAHRDEVVNTTLASFTTLDVGNTSLDERLQEMDAAMARLMAKGDEKATTTAAMDTDLDETRTTPGDFVPEGAAADQSRGVGYPSSSRPFSALPSGTLEETVFHIEGFPAEFPGIGKKSADLAKQLTKEEIADLFSKLKTESWTRSAVERVLQVYQIYKRQLAQEKMLAAPFTKARASVGHGSMGQLSPGSTGTMLMCPNCFSDWQRLDKVQGKCKHCQKNVIAVDKGPPSAEIKLGMASWYMFCGPQGATWHTDADEAQKQAASVDIGSWAQPPPRTTDKTELSFAEQVPMALRPSLAQVQFSQKTAGDRPHLREDWEPSQETRAFHPQLAAAMEIKKKSAGPVAGAHEVDDAPGASVLRHLDTEKLRALLKRNYLQGPGEEFFAAQTSLDLDQAKASNKRMQEEGEARAKVLKPVAESIAIDTWGPALRAALEMDVFNPETPLKDMELDDIEALKAKDRYLNTKFFLSQSRNPFPASFSARAALLGAYPPEEVLGVPVGSVEFQIMRLKRIIELHMGEQRMIGGKWKKVQGPLVAPTWAKSLPEAEKLMLEMRTHPCTFSSAFFEPLALTMEEIEAQIAMGNRPPLENIVGPFHAKDDAGTFPLAEGGADLGPGEPLQVVWSQLHRQTPLCGVEPPPHHNWISQAGAEEQSCKTTSAGTISGQSKEAKDFVTLHGLPVHHLGPGMETVVPRDGLLLCCQGLHQQAFCDFPEIYNTLSASLGQQAVVEVKMAWRCNTEQWWTARLKPEYAGPIYRKLGYSRDPLNPSAPEQELALPPITPDNVSSVASDEYKRKFAGDKTAHVFWARMECGLVLSSVSPWEIVDKNKGVRAPGRFLMITGEHKGKSAQLQLFLDEPPQHLHEEEAAAFVKADWFLNTLEGMMGGDLGQDPSQGLVEPPEHIEVVVPIAAYPRAVFKSGSVVKYVSDNYWKLQVPKHLAELPRMKGVIQDIMAQPALKLDLLPSQTLASKILERAHIVIRGLPDNCCFKIGLTSNPAHRWCNKEYGYQHTSKPCWASMRIVGVLASGEAAGFLEAALIDRWQRDARYLSPSPAKKSKLEKKAPFCADEQSDEKAPDKQSDEKAPDKQSLGSKEKVPHKQSDEKVPDKQSKEKVPKKQSKQKAPDKSDEKAPDKQSTQKAATKQSDDKDYVFPIIRCKYCTQGAKSPLIKIEAREDRHDTSSKWLQKLQVVIKDDLSVRKAMHIARTFADCYVYMNLNPAEINFRGCRDDLLAHNHNWEESALDWQTVNSLRLKHFPKSPKESPIKYPKPKQTEIVEDKPPQGDDDDNDHEGGEMDEEEEQEDDPAVEPSDAQEGSWAHSYERN
ncbi:cpt [Symbiodinium microadriaticum]|nr:cpt [Symbiodinium microadriaticum]